MVNHTLEWVAFRMVIVPDSNANWKQPVNCGVVRHWNYLDEMGKYCCVLWHEFTLEPLEATFTLK